MAGFTTAIALAIGSGVAAGTSIYAMKKQGKSQQKAQDIEKQTYDKEIELRRQEMDEERRRWEAEQDALQKRWDAEQTQVLADRDELRYRWESDEAHAEPYREAGYGALSQLVGRAGLPALGPRQRTPLPASMQPDASAQPTKEVRTLPPGMNRPMADDAALPVMLRDTERGTEPVYGGAQMSPEGYARLATSPEAMAEMTPEERQSLASELSKIPMSALLTAGATRRTRATRRAV